MANESWQAVGGKPAGKWPWNRAAIAPVLYSVTKINLIISRTKKKKDCWDSFEVCSGLSEAEKSSPLGALGAVVLPRTPWAKRNSVLLILHLCLNPSSLFIKAWHDGRCVVGGRMTSALWGGLGRSCQNHTMTSQKRQNTHIYYCI